MDPQPAPQDSPKPPAPVDAPRTGPHMLPERRRLPPTLVVDPRIVTVIRRIDADHIGADSLDALATACGLSPFHLHRLFAATMGETIGGYARRQRLAAAAAQLLDSDEAAQAIGFGVGYGSLAAFSRAFARQFGVSPTAWRTQARAVIAPVRARHRTLARRMRVVTVGALPLIGMRFHGRYDDIDAYWMTFAALLRKHDIATDALQAYAVIRDNPAITPDGLIRYDCCVRDPGLPDPLPAPLTRLAPLPGRYAALEHRGPYLQTEDCYRAISRVWMARHGERSGEAPDLQRFLEPPWAPRVRGEHALTVMMRLR